MSTYARDLKIVTLESSPLFAGLSHRQLEWMARCLDVARIAPDQTLFREGTRADALWIIAEGEVDLSSRGLGLGRVGPGQVLGVAAMLTRAESVLTAVAAGPVRALVASHQQLNQLNACPQVAQRLRAVPPATVVRMAASMAA